MAIKFTSADTPAVEQKPAKKGKVQATAPKAPKPRGFAAMSPEKRKAIAAKGGATNRTALRGFAADIERAKSAGSKGGKAIPKEKRAFSVNKELASRAGKISKPKATKGKDNDNALVN